MTNFDATIYQLFYFLGAFTAKELDQIVKVCQKHDLSRQSAEVSIYISISIYLSTCIFTYLSSYVSLYISIYIYLWIYLSIDVSIYPPISLYTHLDFSIPIKERGKNSHQTSFKEENVHLKHQLRELVIDYAERHDEFRRRRRVIGYYWSRSKILWNT